MQDVDGGLLDFDAGDDPYSPAPADGAAPPEASELRVKEAAAAASAGKSKWLGIWISTNSRTLLVWNSYIILDLMHHHMKWLFFLRLVFPTLQKNDSPFAILPTFIQVLGKKIDSATDQKDIIAMSQT